MVLSTNLKSERAFYDNFILEKCTNFVMSHDMNTIECGKYEIDGEKIFVNIVKYDTKEEKDCIWEAHKQYLDIHYVINGMERIKISNVKNMNCGQYLEKSDYLQLDGEATSEVILMQGQYLTLFLEDAHMTGVKVEDKNEIKKAIFKIHKSIIGD